MSRELSFAELLAERGLCVRSDLLRPFAHWITPPVEPRRYDTKFFAAALPAGQHARDVSGEADEVAWLPPEPLHPISPSFEDTPDGRWAVLPDGTRIRMVVPLPS